MMFFETAYNLGDLGSKAATGINIGSKAAGGIAAGAVAGSIVPVIGTAIGIVAGIITSIFAAHGAKVRREDEVMGVWNDTGQVAVAEVMSLWRSGQIPGSEAIAGLRSIIEQFKGLTSEVVKTGGKFGVFPDPNAPRPAKNCNAACGLFYELNTQVNGYIKEIEAGGDKGMSSLFSGSGSGVAGIPLPLLVIGALILFGVIKI